MSDTNEQLVNQLYQKHLGRAPDAEGRQYWLNMLNNGTLTADTIAPAFLAGKEDDYVTAVRGAYQNVLGREAEPDGLQFWVSALSNGGVTPEGLNEALSKGAQGVNDRTSAGQYQTTNTMYDNITNPTMPVGTEFKPTFITANPDEQLQGPASLDPVAAKPAALATPAQIGPAATATASTAAAPTQVNPSGYNATQVGVNNAPQATAAKGTVDPRSLATAQQADVDPRATVQHQLQNILDGDLRFAQGAITATNETMAARGMGSSSIAAGATAAAILERAFPIAAQDAQVFAQYGIMNLNNRQQTALQNAATYAQVNLANLNNEQQAMLFNTQAKLTTLLSDAAASNAAKQFNAASENQVNMFMSGLQADVAKFNAAQMTAISQFNAQSENTVGMAQAQLNTQTSLFNAGQVNALTQFYDQMNASREQFNAQMSMAVEQANVQWRRQINTANTNIENMANYTNASNLLGLSTWSMNSFWQQNRDEADRIWTSSENDASRAAQVTMTILRNNLQQGLMSFANDMNQTNALLNFSGATIADFIKNMQRT